MLFASRLPSLVGPFALSIGRDAFLFAMIVGPFAMSLSPEAFLFALIVGRKVSLFASQSRFVRKPLVRHEVA